MPLPTYQIKNSPHLSTRTQILSYIFLLKEKEDDGDDMAWIS